MRNWGHWGKKLAFGLENNKKAKVEAYLDKHTLKCFFFQVLAKYLTELVVGDIVKEDNILFIHTCL